ncbi:MAG: MinD/ParA family protein [Alphaproteobacteria bacterium]|nr:MinD/ParA family protein [Alphaproteobacteria bacterium]
MTAATILHPAARPVARNLIAVASGKGGVGKTWLSVTLAHAFAQAGDRVLLFDGDLGLANVDIQIGLTPRFDLGSVIAGQKSLAEAVARFEDGGFDVLPGKSGSGALATLAQQRLNEIRDGLIQVCKSYDLVIADLGAGLEQVVRTMTAAAGRVLVVVNDEPTSLTDAYALIKVTHSQTPGVPMQVVVNSAASAGEGEKTYRTLLRACENFLKIAPPLAGVVRRDERVKDSIRAQSALLTRYPQSVAAADVVALADRLRRER